MKSPLKKITSLTLAIVIAATSTNFLLEPKVAEAQAGKAAACTAGYISAGLALLAGTTQEVIGVSGSNIGTAKSNYIQAASTQGLSFNECILKPLAKVMIITIIRNVGGSVVNWINSGFEGKPSFVTDYGGTLLNAADEAIGTFIEGTELGFLCNNFSFQIRIALALKYSQPFRDKATCTLSDISGNVSDFANSNGGVGWDNWLKLTTEPQNNVYGAYVIADSELAQRALTAVTQKKDRIALGQGFLDYETCDEWAGLGTQGVEVYNTNGVLGATQSSFSTTSTSGYDTARIGNPTGTRFVDPDGYNRKCTKKSTKTPGTVIAGKLNSSFAQGDIQAAVATEIDDVIAATMNQLAQKMIQGAGGLLGLSQKNNTANRQSYLEKYRGEGMIATINTGATSEIEDYTITNFEEANTLIQNNGLVQKIYASTEDTAGTAIDQNAEQQLALDNAIGVTDTAEQNFSFQKPASQSTTGTGPASKAVDGIKGEYSDPYYVNAVTAEEQNPWWQVNLIDPKEIKEVRIWKVAGKPVAETLETIWVIATNDGGTDAWTSPLITPVEGGPNPIIVTLPAGITRKYVRIEKFGTYDLQCRFLPQYDRGQSEYEACHHPLELAEVEVIGKINRPTIGGLTRSTTTPSGEIAGPVVPKTLNLVASSSSPLSLSASVPFNYDVQVVANHSTSSLTVETVFRKNGQTLAVGNIFSGLVVTTRRGNGPTVFTTINASAPGMSGDRVSVSNTEKFVFGFAGQKKVNAVAGTYTIESTLIDSRGVVLDTQITEFVVQ